MITENIQSTLQEDRLFPPPAIFAAKARLCTDDLPALYQRFALLLYGRSESLVGVGPVQE